MRGDFGITEEHIVTHMPLNFAFEQAIYTLAH